MAKTLVETLAGDFDPSEFEDDYRQALEALVQAKIEGGEITAAPAARKSSGEVVDLLAALQRSVDAARSARGEAVETAHEPSGPTKKATKRAPKKASTKAS